MESLTFLKSGTNRVAIWFEWFVFPSVNRIKWAENKNRYKYLLTRLIWFYVFVVCLWCHSVWRGRKKLWSEIWLLKQTRLDSTTVSWRLWEKTTDSCRYQRMKFYLRLPTFTRLHSLLVQQKNTMCFSSSPGVSEGEQCHTAFPGGQTDEHPQHGLQPRVQG